MEKIRKYFTSQYENIFLAAFIAMFLVLFSILAIKGSYSRYAQDDYCYGYRFRTANFWKAQLVSYFQPTEYNSNRYSLTMFNGLAELAGGPNFAPFLPILVMVSWVCILVYVVSLFIKSRRNILILITAGMVIVFFTFLLAPNMYQVLFWVASINTYTTPILISTFILARILHFTFTGKFTIFNIVEVVLLNILAGGFSETSTAWLLALWICTFAAFLCFRPKDLFRKAMWPLILAIVGTLIAIVIMLVNPTNSIRVSFYHSQSLLAGLWQSFSYGLLFVKRSIKFSLLPFGVIAILGFWLGAHSQAGEEASWKRKLAAIAAILAITFLLCAADMAPSVILTDSYPGDRQLFPAAFSLVFGLFASGWVSAKLVLPLAARLIPQKVVSGVLFVVGIVMLVYLGTTFPQVYNKLPLYQARAVAWDARQKMILDEKSAGLVDITVPEFDSIYGITELGTNRENWVNRCAAWYYGVKSISAVDGYMGIGAYPIGK
jgi:hypothetical protein